MGFNSGFKGLNYFDGLCNTFFKGRLPEGGHNRWPKHAAGYAVYNNTNLYTSVYVLVGPFLVMNHQCRVLNHLKYITLVECNR